MKEGSTVRIIPEAKPSVVSSIIYGVRPGEYIIPTHIYDKYLSEGEKWGAVRGPVVYSPGIHRDKVGIILKSIDNISGLHRNLYYLVLFGDDKVIVPDDRLVEAQVS